MPVYWINFLSNCKPDWNKKNQMPRLQLPKFLQSKLEKEKQTEKDTPISSLSPLEKEILKEKDAAAREGLTEDNFFTYSYHCNAIG